MMQVHTKGRPAKTSEFKIHHIMKYYYSYFESERKNTNKLAGNDNFIQ